jgi:RNA polymerase sigma-70 factor (ECF subfamily)
MIRVSTMAEINLDASVDLLLKAQAGDDAALNTLLARYLPRLQRWAKGRLPAGIRTMIDTGDLVQDAIIHALRHLNTLEIRTEGALQAYLRRAVNNRIIDLYRRAGRRPGRDEITGREEDPGASPLEQAIGAEALASYERSLAALKDEEREAIVLRVELGLDYAEMALQLGKPTADAARMAVKRAIARLAQEMSRAQ